tara:strand:- start:1473 stop:2144 length:672 start_codon:yes stop_codon:yes gene_type:complete
MIVGCNLQELSIRDSENLNECEIFVKKMIPYKFEVNRVVRHYSIGSCKWNDGVSGCNANVLNKGENEGENINYFYLKGHDLIYEKEIISEDGTILAPNKFKLRNVVYEPISSERQINFNLYKFDVKIIDYDIYECSYTNPINKDLFKTRIISEDEENITVKSYDSIECYCMLQCKKAMDDLFGVNCPTAHKMDSKSCRCGNPIGKNIIIRASGECDTIIFGVR